MDPFFLPTWLPSLLRLSTIVVANNAVVGATVPTKQTPLAPALALGLATVATAIQVVGLLVEAGRGGVLSAVRHVPVLVVPARAGILAPPARPCPRPPGGTQGRVLAPPFGPIPTDVGRAKVVTPVVPFP